VDAIVAWAVAFMLTLGPPGRSKMAGAEETAEEGLARYREIARAAATVAFDPSSRLLFRGPHARSQTLAVLLSVAHHESGFRKDVDLGVGPFARGSGLDSCLLQIRIGKGATREGWNHADLVSDRTKCFRAGLAMMRLSAGACRSMGVRDMLSAYASGRCSSPNAESRALLDPALRAPSAPLDDAAVIAALPNPAPAPAALP
jgi:hypothetical protein